MPATTAMKTAAPAKVRTSAISAGVMPCIARRYRRNA